MSTRIAKKTKFHPLSSWDISNPIYNSISKKTEDLEVLRKISLINNWNVDFAKELAIHYETLVLTDLDQKILWVNNGFEKMTGYPPEFAIGKRPAFLQGPNTSDAVKARIRKKLSNGDRISDIVTNYKKNGKEYECEITIIPLFDADQVITHYLALEREAA
ncbi:PAS domain-containing protein [Algoriphagus sp. SE2]|uniref:PAS domain-containing protein n=1 Tax=Algoriphagus sp. SE2 TaxID=3141536 RepID=UPI0031CD5E30